MNVRECVLHNVMRTKNRRLKEIKNNTARET